MSGFVTDRQATAVPLTIALQFPQSEVSLLASGALQLMQPSLTFANFMMPPDPELGVATRILLVWSPAVGQHDTLEKPCVLTAGRLAHANMPNSWLISDMLCKQKPVSLGCAQNAEGLPRSPHKRTLQAAL